MIGQQKESRGYEKKKPVANPGLSFPSDRPNSELLYKTRDGTRSCERERERIKSRETKSSKIKYCGRESGSMATNLKTGLQS